MNLLEVLNVDVISESNQFDQFPAVRDIQFVVDIQYMAFHCPGTDSQNLSNIPGRHSIAEHPADHSLSAAQRTVPR